MAKQLSFVYKNMVLLSLSAIISISEGASILFLIPTSTHSETHFFEPLIQALSTEHNVTVVTTVHSPNLPKSVEQVIPLSAQEIFGSFGLIPEKPPNFLTNLYYECGVTTTGPAFDAIYESADFKRVVLDSFGTYDLVFVNFLMAQVFYGIVHLNQSPFILLNSFPNANYLTQDVGLYAPPSTVPFPLSTYNNDMTFSQRLVNHLLDWSTGSFNTLYNLPFMERVYRKHLGEDIPSIWEIQKNASLVMTNTHFTSTYHRPLMPDVVEIGGIHCRKSKKLAKELQNFLGNSSFIYVSFGTVMKSWSLSQSIVSKFFAVFANLAEKDVKVVMKLELTEEHKKKLKPPQNVLLGEWFEQQDLLGHPNLLLFISHAGLLSTQQAICHATPALLFPHRFDQRVNAQLALSQGYALSLDLWEFSEKDLEGAIDQLITEPKYRENAVKVSNIFHDQPTSPLERALFWTNHILKYKGAPHLRSSARELHYLQFHNFDVMCTLLAFAIILPILLVKSAVWIVKKLWGYKKLQKS